MAAGYPGIFPGGLTTGYKIIGAVQKQVSGAAGYPGVFPGGLTTGYTTIGAVQKNVGSDISLALTGIASTLGIGTVVIATTLSLTGIASELNIGTLVATAQILLAGSDITSELGTVTSNINLVIEGLASTSAVGSLVPSTTVAIVGSIIYISTTFIGEQPDVSYYYHIGKTLVRHTIKYEKDNSFFRY